MNQSKKHHYIPRFYLEGFTEKSRYFVYDKTTHKIWETNPMNSFAENRRNSGKNQNLETGQIEYSDSAELMLARLDSIAAKVIASFININNHTRIGQYALLNLQLFIASLFWRVPANEELRKFIFETHSFSSLGFGIFHQETRERNREAENLLKQVESFEKSYQSFLPITSFLGKNRRNLSDLEIYYRADDSGIISDNPVIIREFKGFESLKGELIFPLSRSYLMVLTQKRKPTLLPPDLENEIDILLFLKAKRFVACHNKEYLQFLADEYGGSNAEPDLQTKLFDEIFSIFG